MKRGGGGGGNGGRGGAAERRAAAGRRGGLGVGGWWVDVWGMMYGIWWDEMIDIFPSRPRLCIL